MRSGVPIRRRIAAASCVRRDSDVERLALSNRRVKGAHGLLEWGMRVVAMGIEDVDVVETHPPQALVEAGQQVLSRAPDPIWSRPHVIAGLARDHQLVTTPGEIALENATEILFRRAVWRTIVVGQVEVGDAEVEGAADDPPLGFERPVTAKVLPQPERDGREQEAAPPAAPVRHPDIALAVRHHVHGSILPLPSAATVCDPCVGLHPERLALPGWIAGAIG